MKLILYFLLISAIVFMTASDVFAQSRLELSEKVREKKYKGSFDEDELKVQKDFIHPSQKSKAEEADEGF